MSGALRMPLASVVLVHLVLSVTACDDGGPVDPTPGDPTEESFFFEDGMEGWEAVAIDTLNPPIDWRVEHTAERARSKTGSVELYLENLNDQGKIWMERAFELEPGVEYDVEIAFAFSTADWGDVNLFRIIAGAHESPPRDHEALVYQDETGHGQGSDAGHVWLEKEYELTLVAPEDGMVLVAIGVWGSWETARTYYVDEVFLRFTPRTS